MNECYCSYGDDVIYPDEYEANTIEAKEVLKCLECFSMIRVGESYEKVEVSWEGEKDTIYTCEDCLRIRKLMEESRKCFRWTHYSFLDDLYSFFECANFEPGERFFYLRELSTHRCRIRYKQTLERILK